MNRLRRLAPLLLLLVCLAAAGPVRGADDEIPPAWHGLLQQAAGVTDPGARAVLLSERFLGVPYRADTLVGGPDRPEQLVVRLEAVDCFTFLDYVEALRRSTSAGEFRERLAQVRYRDGLVAWERRRHFFTDWAAAPGGRILDVTREIGGDRTRQALKQLNRKADGSLILPGVAVQERFVSYLPAAALDAGLLDRLRPGDYLGIYTAAAGLDVTHVGLAVRHDGRLLLRHASSRREAGRVVDSDLAAYLAGKPGLVVLRPR
ncbi:MAG: DUF1460 domain-containing protein [Deltaproteobacteria bacterium]|nr:MAG: DUF1460 domain-containing protein [Deltaproteobacteria bacterium]